MKISKQKLQQIIKEELLHLNEIFLPQRIKLKLEDLNEVMPAARKICELLPIECSASIQYYWCDFERTLTYEEAVAKYDSHAATHYGIQWINPVLIINLGSTPSTDSHDDFCAICPAHQGIFLSTGDRIFRSTLIKQENCESYDELNYAIIDAVNELLLLRADVVFKKDYNLDVDLD